jgi:DNA-binding FrmR family transcriptional regulator
MKNKNIKIEIPNINKSLRNDNKINNDNEINNVAINTVYLKEDLLKDLELRLKKIEGQIKGIQNMLKAHKNCDDIIIQIMAVKAALNSVAIKLLKGHIKSCIKFKNNNYLILNNFLNSLEKIFKEVK